MYCRADELKELQASVSKVTIEKYQGEIKNKFGRIQKLLREFPGVRFPLFQLVGFTERFVLLPVCWFMIVFGRGRVLLRKLSLGSRHFGLPGDLVGR
jgi:hypothetical protein